jgi:hypothetical protein
LVQTYGGYGSQNTNLQKKAQIQKLLQHYSKTHKNSSSNAAARERQPSSSPSPLAMMSSRPRVPNRHGRKAVAAAAAAADSASTTDAQSLSVISPLQQYNTNLHSNIISNAPPPPRVVGAAVLAFHCQ